MSTLLSGRPTSIDKANPSPEWIESIRRLYPVEREIDRVLTAKLNRRAGPGYSAVSLDRISDGLRRLIARELDTPHEISGVEWLGGGASKLQVSFYLTWEPDGQAPITERMVLRMELPESNAETSRRREFEVLGALQGTLPVPRPYWIDAEGEFLPYPAIVCSFVSGVTKPVGRKSQVTGLGIDYGPDLRPIIGPQVIRDMAKLHAWDWQSANLPSFDVPTLGTQAVEWHLNNWCRVWEEDSGQEEPLLSFATLWLRDNMPEIDRLSLIHCDFRAGNFLIDEDTGQITAWLDWELARIGDRHEDLAFMSLGSMGHVAEDGKTFLVNGLMPEAELLNLYERESGQSVDLNRLAYYRIFHAYRASIILLASGYRAVRGGKTNQDMTLTVMLGFGGRMLDELRALLERHA